MTYIVRLLIIIASVGSVCSALFFYFRTTERNNNVLTVGMFVWPPFMSIKPDGTYEGFDVDVAQAVADALGKKLEVIDMGTLAPLFIALEQNKIDLIFSGLDITQKRQQELIMVPYVGENITSLSLLFWKEIPANIQTMQDLANVPNAVLCYEPGSASENFLKQFNGFEQKPLGAVVDMVMDIKYGKSTAAILEQAIAQRVAQQNPEIKLLSVPLGAEFQIYGMGIAIKKSNQKLAEQVRSAIALLQSSGTLRTLESKWGLAGAQ